MSQGKSKLEKTVVKPEWGSQGQGSLAPPDGYGQGRSGPGQKLANPQLTPSAFWNEDPRNQWFDCSNLGMAMIDGVKTTCLIDNGAWVNLVNTRVREEQRPGGRLDPGP